jgi:RHS repeat-associated protein
MYGDMAYAPYGELYAQTGSGLASFTGIDQATVYNEYDFPAREYGIQGRWPSPDPAGLAAVDPSNPQSWNRYAYVDNDPLSSIDPSGLFTCTDIGCPPPDPGPGPGPCDPFGGCFGPGGGGSGGGGLPSNCQFSPACLCHWRGNCQFVFGRKAQPKPPTTIGPNPNYEGSKKQLCDQKSNRALLVDILPFGSTLLGGDYSPATVGEAGAGMVAGQAIDYVAGSPKALRSIRSLTGSLTGVRVPMTLTARFLSYLGYATTLYSGYHALNASKDVYQACMAN